MPGVPLKMKVLLILAKTPEKQKINFSHSVIFHASNILSIIVALRKFAKSKIQPCCQEFKASRAWLQKFSQRHGLALRRRTPISQRLPKQPTEKLYGPYEMCAK